MIDAAYIARLRGLCHRELPGHSEKWVSPNVAVCCIEPEARKLLDKAMDEWAKHLKEMPTAPEDPVYAFAYWLIRWSGLVIPQAREAIPALCDEVERLAPLARFGEACHKMDELRDEMDECIVCELADPDIGACSDHEKEWQEVCREVEEARAALEGK